MHCARVLFPDPDSPTSARFAAERWKGNPRHSRHISRSVFCFVPLGDLVQPQQRFLAHKPRNQSPPYLKHETLWAALVGTNAGSRFVHKSNCPDNAARTGSLASASYIRASPGTTGSVCRRFAPRVSANADAHRKSARV